MPATVQTQPLERALGTVNIGERFTVDEFPHLPLVELVRKCPASWVVAEIRPDGGRDNWTFRLSKRGLAGKTIRILPNDFAGSSLSTATLPANPDVPNPIKEEE